MIGSALFAGCRSQATPSSRIVADSVRDFSGEQGQAGWYYGYWDRTADADRIYQTTDFQPLISFGNDPINQLSSRSEFTTGPLWNLRDGVFYTSLWAEGGHPHAPVRHAAYAQAEQWAVRRWVSTIDAPIVISGHVGKVMPWGENWSGGCRARIVVDGIEVDSVAIDNQGTDYKVNASVRKGSTVDFLIGPDPSFGVSSFTAVIRSNDQ
jgi:hypothetical protein